MKNLLLKLFGFTAIGIIAVTVLMYGIVIGFMYLETNQIIDIDRTQFTYILYSIYTIIYVVSFTIFFNIITKPYKWSKNKRIGAYIFTFLILTMLIPMWLDGGRALNTGVSSIIEQIVR